MCFRAAYFLCLIILAALSPPLFSSEESVSNFVLNPGFEEGAEESPTSWRFSSWKDSEGQWSEDFAYEGLRSLSLAGANGGWSAEIPVKPGALHRLSLRYRAEGGPSKLVAYVRDLKAATAAEKVLLYDSEPTIAADEEGKFVEGEYIEGADENGWVEFDGGYFAVAGKTETASLLIKLVSESADAKLWIDDVRVVAQPLEQLPDTAAVLTSIPGATVWWEDENRKVFPTQALPTGRETGHVGLDLAKGEYGSFQVVVTPEEDWTDVDWSWENTPGFDLRCRLVETIPITETQGPFGQTGQHPDPLTEALPCAIVKGTNQSFWFTVRVPTDQKAGTYENEIVLTRGGDELCRIPVQLDVRDFAIPREPSIDVYSGFRSGLVRDRETGEVDSVMKRYYRSYFEHRTRCAPAARFVARVSGDQVVLEADKYLEHLRFIRDEFGPRPFFLPALWISHEGHRLPVDAEWKGIRIFSDKSLTSLNPGFTAPFRDFMNQFVVRLKDEELFTDPIVRFIDEPNLEDPVTVAGIRTLATFFHEIDPEIIVSLTAASIHPNLVGMVNQWVLHTDAWSRSREEIGAARAAGCRISVYNNATNLVDYEPIRTRLWPWLLKKYEVDGSNSWWGTICWRSEVENPWTAGTGTSGVLLYPPRTPDEHGPIESVRWELFRQGLQDYEYMQLAEQLAVKLEAGGESEAAIPGRKAIENALSLVDKWPQVRPANDRPYNRDVTKLRAARRQLADAIETMMAVEDSTGSSH